MVNARMTFDRESLKPLYQMIIGEAGESCAIYIAKKLGMPGRMLREAAACAYGGEGLPSGREPGGFDRTREELEELLSDAKGPQELQKQRNHSVRREKKKDYKPLTEKFSIGDSVMIFPDKKIGIVCEPVNEKGVHASPASG